MDSHLFNIVHCRSGIRLQEMCILQKIYIICYKSYECMTYTNSKLVLNLKLFHQYCRKKNLFNKRYIKTGVPTKTKYVTQKRRIYFKHA